MGGFTGEELERQLRQIGIKTDFVHLKNGITRINVKLKGDRETEINAAGPIISKDELDEIFKKLDNLGAGDTLFLTGSVPASVPDDIYQGIMQRLSPKGVRFVVDAVGSLLLNSLKYKPFLIKPNKQELEDIFETEFKNEAEIFDAAFDLKNKGAVNVLVSLGSDGAILVDEHGNRHSCKAYVGKTVNTVGAGDSMIAGFIAGYPRGYDYALRLGSAAGAATAFSPSLATKAQILSLI